MKGIYVLAISVNKNIIVNVGVLYEVFFEKGTYVYVGAAQDSIEKRTARHVSRILNGDFGTSTICLKQKV